ncbi:MAG: phosphoribosylformylglycinamidine cyclo-ligase [Actinomycetota bacterium]|nr:phosphoribosylformylglycinamidine cyclo-ligase [Actinomycetota bacterium]
MSEGDSTPEGDPSSPAGPGQLDTGPSVTGESPLGATYAVAGVDLAAAEQALERIKGKVRSTFRPEVIGDVGGFGGLFAFDTGRHREPVLVGSTDGVGTKALIAQATGRFSTIGIDLVAMCVDDLVCHGAEPLFFLDYIAVGRLDPDHIEDLVEGVAEGCRQAGCALIGGEMAEHPGAMEPGQFDLVGFAVGVAERSRVVSGARLEAGDVLLGLPSPGLRSNGYSLARHVFFEVAGRSLDDPAYPGSHHSLADELLEPSTIYAPAVTALLRSAEVRAVAHITGGGIPAKLGRVLPRHLDAVVRCGAWEQPPVFDEIRRLGAVTHEEMARVFNLGLGMIVAVAPDDAFPALDVLRTHGHRAVGVGEIVPGRGHVVLEP